MALAAARNRPSEGIWTPSGDYLSDCHKRTPLGNSTFVYTIVLTRLGVAALTASQIVIPIENLFIVAASGLALAAVASIGQALGDDFLKDAKKHANAALRLGF